MAKAPDAVEEKEKEEESSDARRAGAEPAPAGEAGSPGPWREALTTLALALFFPGTGHVYAGFFRRGILWSVLFLGVAFPLVLVAYGVWYTFSPTALAACALFLFAILLTSAVAPVVRAWRRARARPALPPRPGIHVVALYASAIALLTAGEAAFFLNAVFESRRVASSRLEPLLSRSGVVTVLRSRYVTPVHGDVVLYRDPGTPGSPGAERLARVVALPGDTVEARKGKLLVNGIEVDLARNDQRLELERAGRAERRRRFLSSLTARPLDRLQERTAVDWRGADWGPLELPAGRYLCLPDAEPAEGTPPDSGAAGLMVPKDQLLGRALL